MFIFFQACERPESSKCCNLIRSGRAVFNLILGGQFWKCTKREWSRILTHRTGILCKRCQTYTDVVVLGITSSFYWLGTINWWRRRQREVQKNNRLGLAKQQLCTCITLFCTFLCRHCKTTTRKCLISRFMEDVNKLLWNFLSHSELGYGFSGIQLRESSPTSDKVIELELSRWRLNEREFTF